MTVRSVESVAVHSVDIGARLVTDVRLDEAIALRRCAIYRTAFRGTSIGYPADSDNELVVQTSVNVSHKALPIPPSYFSKRLTSVCQTCCVVRLRKIGGLIGLR